MSARRVAILGGGLSGLAAAKREHRAGHQVALFEASGRLGGAVQSEASGEWLFERGPHTLQGTPAVLRLLHELNLNPVTAGAGGPLKRYIVRGGRLVALPSSPRALLAGNYFSWRTKARILRERVAPLPVPRSDVSFGDLVRHRFGPEVLTWAVQPFVSGIYAGDPDQLSSQFAFPRLWSKMQESGSVFRAAAGESDRAGSPPLLSFAGGLDRLTRALSGQLPSNVLRMHTPVLDVAIQSDGQWQVAGESFDAVRITVPARAASVLTVNGERHGAASALASIPHPPLTVLNLGYPRSAVAHPLDGFGCLIPAVENRSLLGIIFTSTLFPDRTPKGHISLTVMLGGTLQPAQAMTSEAEALATCCGDLRELLGIADDPSFVACTHYPASIPQMTLTHSRTLAALTAVEAAHSGLHFDGSYRHGISLPDCLSSGQPEQGAAAAIANPEATAQRGKSRG